MAAKLYLVVRPAQELNVPVCPHTAQITGIVEPFAGPGVGQKLPRGLLWILPVTQSDTQAANVDFPDTHVRTGAKCLIAHVHVLVWKRPSIRNAVPIGSDLIDWIID